VEVIQMTILFFIFLITGEIFNSCTNQSVRSQCLQYAEVVLKKDLQLKFVNF